MKNILLVVTLLTLLFSFSACSSNTTSTDSAPSAQLQLSDDQASPAQETDEQNDASLPDEPLASEDPSPADEPLAPEDSSSTDEAAAQSLVVYFSWSGNTRNVAEAIQAQTDSDIFEIVPAVPYSNDYDTVVDLAQEEQRDNARPAISESIENMEQYDVIYVGFPNWWDDMPMILYTFFDTYDLSGKTVALFCTSGGSGLSNTVNEVKSLEPDAIVTEGLHIGSGSASTPDTAVSEWLSRIGAAN